MEKFILQRKVVDLGENVTNFIFVKLLREKKFFLKAETGEQRMRYTEVTGISVGVIY